KPSKESGIGDSQSTGILLELEVMFTYHTLPLGSTIGKNPKVEYRTIAHKYALFGPYGQSEKAVCMKSECIHPCRRFVHKGSEKTSWYTGENGQAPGFYQSLLSFSGMAINRRIRSDNH